MLLIIIDWYTHAQLDLVKSTHKIRPFELGEEIESGSTCKISKIVFVDMKESFIFAFCHQGNNLEWAHPESSSWESVPSQYCYHCYPSKVQILSALMCPPASCQSSFVLLEPSNEVTIQIAFSISNHINSSDEPIRAQSQVRRLSVNQSEAFFILLKFIATVWNTS